MRKAVNRGSLKSPSRDRVYWMSGTPEERFAAVEALRKEFYGADAVEQPMRKDIVRILQRPES
jgi:hypothetical protein